MKRLIIAAVGLALVVGLIDASCTRETVREVVVTPTGEKAISSPPASTPPATAEEETPAGPAFEELLASFKTATFHGKYDVRANGIVIGNMEWYQLPPRTRLDRSFSGRTVTILVTPGGSFTCTGGECRNTPEIEGTLIGGLDDLLTGARVESDSRRTIAGRDAFCFEVEAAREINFETGEVCFDVNGFPLLLIGGDEGGEGAIEATEVSDRVPSDAFDWPQ